MAVDESDLPSTSAIIAAAKVVINDFPYEQLEGFNTFTTPTDNFTDVDMIKSDFDNFTEADIEANNEIIDEYYSQNLDYQVLDEIAKHPNFYENLSKSSSSDFWIAACTMARALTHGYGLVRPAIA